MECLSSWGKLSEPQLWSWGWRQRSTSRATPLLFECGAGWGDSRWSFYPAWNLHPMNKLGQRWLGLQLLGLLNLGKSLCLVLHPALWLGGGQEALTSFLVVLSWNLASEIKVGAWEMLAACLVWGDTIALDWELWECYSCVLGHTLGRVEFPSCWTGVKGEMGCGLSATNSYCSYWDLVDFLE